MRTFRAVIGWLLRPVAAFVPKRVKQRMKQGLRRNAIRFARFRYGLVADDLGDFLRVLGVQRGDVLFVHSSFDAFRGFVDLPPLAAIKVLQDAVGPEGTLAMPTLPFTGSALMYVASDPVFDVRRTPSKAGLLTELFRRMPGVVRSVHPTHPAAVWGAKATALVRNHELADTPCGRPSPYQKLLDHDGRILMLGTGIMAMTFFHTVDELLESALPFTPFTKARFVLRSRDLDGRVVETRTRLYDPASAEARARFERSLPVLMKKAGTWRQDRIGELDAILIDANDVVDALQRAVR